MKKLISFLGLLMLILTSTIFTSCEKESVIPDVPGEPIEFKGFKSDSGIIVNDEQIQIVGSGLKSDANEFIYYDLKDYVGKKITIDFSCKMKTSNSTGVNLMWQILDGNSYPIVASNNSVKTDWITVEGSKEVRVAEGYLFYLSTYQLDFSNLKIWLKDINFKISVPTKVQNPEDEWMVAPSLREAYEGKLDYIGMSVQWNDWLMNRQELGDSKVQAGLKRHFNSITMGNEMKPDGFLNSYAGAPTKFEKFTASNGKTIDVPMNQLSFNTVDNCLAACKNIDAKMRGHVLVWHSQTPNWFFNSNYSSNGSLVDEATMTARQEWYIKSVLEHIKDWEDKNNNGERIIYCWDVVNEAADDSETQLRSASNWYKIYKDDEFIVNAFRFANKYVPKDVLLAYNDYQEYNEDKRAMILKIIKSVQSHENDSNLPTRIDVLGMQSHNKYGNPTMSNYEDTIKKYLATGLDIHITELDIGAMTTADAKDAQKLKKEYYDSFKLYLKYAKKGSEPGVTSVTIWGLIDGSTWLNTDSQQPWLNNVYQYPLLFDDDYYAKPAFYGVLEAAQ